MGQASRTGEFEVRAAAFLTGAMTFRAAGRPPIGLFAASNPRPRPPSSGPPTTKTPQPPWWKLKRLTVEVETAGIEPASAIA
jgi:hypothetical protein